MICIYRVMNIYALGRKKIYNNGGMPDSYGEKYAQ